MVDNNDEEHLNIPSNIHSENSSDEIIPAEDIDIITPNQETENMEVHHPHGITHKKKWAEYLLEFFMLFLAVFLGFLAENKREHQIEKAKEKEYMHTMLLDLKKDTSSINYAIYGNRVLISCEDSALHFLSADLNNKDTATMAFIYFFKYCVNLSYAPISDGTITQLKNNGGLRLIRDKEVIEKINSYYTSNAIIVSTESKISEFLTINGRQAGEIFNCLIM